MNIPWLDCDTPLPTPESAQKKGSPLAGLVAAGGGLSVTRLCEAYQQGMFPWFSEGQPVLWWSPDPRMVLPTQNFKLHRSLRKTLHHFIESPNCEIRMDTAFPDVIRCCAQAPRHGQAGTWIVEEMIEAYIALHNAGLAHSVETWIDHQLVGGCIAYRSAIHCLASLCLRTRQTPRKLPWLRSSPLLVRISWIGSTVNKIPSIWRH